MEDVDFFTVALDQPRQGGILGDDYAAFAELLFCACCQRAARAGRCHSANAAGRFVNGTDGAGCRLRQES